MDIPAGQEEVVMVVAVHQNAQIAIHQNKVLPERAHPVAIHLVKVLPDVDLLQVLRLKSQDRRKVLPAEKARENQKAVRHGK